MKIFYYLKFIGIVFLLFSCSGGNTEYILTSVTREDFTESIQIEGVVEAVNSVAITCPVRYEVTISYLIDEGVNVKKGDTVCILEFEQLVSTYDARLKSLSSARAEYAKLEASLALDKALLEAQVKNNEIETAIVFMDSLQMEYSSEVQKKLTRLEIKKAEITKRKLQDKLASLEAINKAQLRKMSLQIKQYELYISNLEDMLKELVLIAPQDGMATIATYYNGEKLKIGDQIWSGDPIVNLPDLSSVKILLEVPESKFKRLKLKQPVDITFDAVPGMVAKGEISLLTPVGKPVSKSSKIKVFDVTVSVNEISKIPDLGITAKCKVIIKSEENCLVIPQVAVDISDSLKYVYVMRHGKIEKQQIETGSESVEDAVILRGLSENDVILLNKPKNSQVHNINHLDSIKNNKNTNDTIKVVQTAI